MKEIWQIFNIILLISLCSNLTPTIQNKSHTHETRSKSPSEKENIALKEALYCNSDNMKQGDFCYCGRLFMSCCTSKDKCSGTFSRDCSVTVSDDQCDSQVSQGLAYWQETQNLKTLIECSNKHDLNASTPCYCGKVFKTCCYSKSHCSISLLSENCDHKSEDSSCEAEMNKNRKQTKPKYYTVYSDFWSSDSKKISVFYLILLMIYLVQL